MARTIEIAGSGKLTIPPTPEKVRARAQLAAEQLTVTTPQARIARPKTALTGSAATPDPARGGLRRLDQSWQREVMRHYRETGECWNPAQYYSRALERIRFYPALLSERNQPEEVTEGRLLDLFRRIRSPGGAPGDLSAVAGVYGRLQFLIGDGYLMVSEEEGEEVWEYLSPMELRLKPESSRRGRNEYWRLRAPGAVPEDLGEAADDEFEPVGDSVRVWRLWRPSPEYTQMADSPLRPVLDLYRLLERLTMAATAEASSRAAQRGAFFVPDEWSFGPSDQTHEENPDEDPLLMELQRAMARAILNPDSAEAMAPFLIRAPGVTQTSGGAVPTKDLAGPIAMGPEDRYPEAEVWDAVVGRIAGSIDMPKELLTGVGDVNHWTAWMLQEEGFNAHTGPVLVRFCRDLASAYLRPAAVKANVEGAERAVIWFDASPAITHPDKTGTALAAHKALAVSDGYLRQIIGAGEEAKPDDEELRRRVAIELREFPSDLAPEPSEGETSPAEGGTGDDARRGPPPRSQPNRRSQTREPAPAGPSMSQMVLGAAMLQLDWTRERAGNRLVRRAQSCEPCKELIGGVASPLVAAVLGREQVLGVIDGHTTEGSLVEGTADRFAARLEAWGVDGGWPAQLGQMVEQHALRTLYETEVPPMPPGFQAAVERALSGS